MAPAVVGGPAVDPGGRQCDGRTRAWVFAQAVHLFNQLTFFLCSFLRIHEKDGKIKSVEELLQAEILKVASKEKTVQVPVSATPTFLSVSAPLTTIYLLLHGIR